MNDKQWIVGQPRCRRAQQDRSKKADLPACASCSQEGTAANEQRRRQDISAGSALTVEAPRGQRAAGRRLCQMGVGVRHFVVVGEDDEARDEAAQSRQAAVAEENHLW